jgi:hypothetical protein
MNEKSEHVTRNAFLAWCGIAVAIGGVLTVLINVGLTPFLDADAPYPKTAASSVFLWRQSLSALAAVLLLIGSVGLYLRQAATSGRFGVVAFLLAFLGSALLLANEWVQVFFVRGLAITAPGVLQTMDSAEGPSLFDTGAMIAFVAFTLGWIVFAISMLRAGLYSRKGPLLLIVGLLAVPILAAVLPDVLGLIVGNVMLGAGWFLLGRELHTIDRTDAEH